MTNEEGKSIEQIMAEDDVDGFRRSLGPFVVAAETTRMPMVFMDAREPDNPIIFANDSFLSLTGYSREEVLGQSFNFLMALGTDPEALAKIKAAFKENSRHDPEIRYRRKDGTEFWAALFISAVHDESGEVVQHFASLADLTRHKHEENRLRFFLGELNHRTRNMLATVQAIARQTLRDGASDAAVDAFDGRILALAKVHGLLGRENWTGINLRDVIDQILHPFGLHALQATRFSISGQGKEVYLPPHAAITIALVLHELAVNAVTHGALSNAAGRIDLAWRVEPTPRGDKLRLRWRENGGPPVIPPVRKGFGSRLIESGLALELDEEVHCDYEPAGVVCHIVMIVPGEVDET